MTALTPYTSTYTDVDGNVFDADDLVNEFWRVAEFLALWSGSIDAIGHKNEFEEYIEVVEGELAEILPSNGLIQRLEVAADVTEFEVNIRDHQTGDPYRVFIIIRCLSQDTRFRVESLAGEAHTFGLNLSRSTFRTEKETFKPSQVLGDGFYTATLICTFGSANGVMVQVMGANTEESAVDYNDVLTAVPE